MKLRPALAARVVALALPLAILAGVGLARVEREQARERVAARVLARIDELGPERCLDAPPRWARPFGPRHGPERHHGARVTIYDASLAPRSPGGQPLPEPLARAARSGADVAGVVLEGRGPRHEAVLVRTPFSEGPCAFVVVTRRIEPHEGLGAFIAPAVFVGALFAIAVLVASGGIVRRIVRLAEGVRSGRKEALVDSHPDEIGDLARALHERESRIAEQLAELAARESALRAYIADTTHDVLVPLTVLSGELDTVAKAGDAGVPVPRESIRVALEEAQYVGSLLHNLNARARLEGGLVTRADSVSLDAIVERVVARHRVVASRLGVSIDHAVPEEAVFVAGDPTLLEQAISNLVHNAVRHNQPGGHVAVVLTAPPERFVLTVVDDGPGVPEEMLSRLGERGLRTNEARTRTPDGTGLGLHIVREVVAIHGLSLSFASGDGAGLSVRIEGARLAGPDASR